VLVGLSVYGIGARDLVALAQEAEACGFDRLWLGEHLLLPVDYSAVHPTRDAATERAAAIVGRETRLVDPLVALGAVAAATTTLRLATGIYLLALRHPLAAARGVLTLQELAEGRLTLGVGAGWLIEEFDALGVPWDDRTQRLTESVEILRRAFSGGPFEHHGACFDFGRVQLTSRPVDVPVVLGGNSPAALRRAAGHGDGWFASGNPSQDEALALVRRVRHHHERAGRIDPFPVTVRVSPPTTDGLGAYAAAGIDEVVFWAHELCPAPPDAGVGVGPEAPGRWDGLADAAIALGLRPTRTDSRLAVRT
jgi:probable F420-dependent oxidoreductase